MELSPQLLVTEYLPSNELTADFWQKYYNYDLKPEGEYCQFRFNTTIYLNPLLLETVSNNLEAVNKGIKKIDLSMVSNYIDNYKKIELWTDRKDYLNSGLGISIDFCAGNEVYNKFRKKNKYKERWTLELHLRFENPDRVSSHIKRKDTQTVFNTIKDVNDILDEIKERIAQFARELKDNHVWLRFLTKENSNEYNYKFEDKPALIGVPTSKPRKRVPTDAYEKKETAAFESQKTFSRYNFLTPEEEERIFCENNQKPEEDAEQEIPYDWEELAIESPKVTIKNDSKNSSLIQHYEKGQSPITANTNKSSSLSPRMQTHLGNQEEDRKRLGDDKDYQVNN